MHRRVKQQWKAETLRSNGKRQRIIGQTVTALWKFVSFISLYTKILAIFSYFIIATIGLHYLDGLQSTALAIDHQVESNARSMRCRDRM